MESLVLSEIRNPAIVLSPGFGAVFNSEFDEVVLEYSRPFEIGKIIDAIEGMGNPKVGVEYPADLVKSSHDNLFTSGTLGKYSKVLNSVIERRQSR